MPGPHSYSQYRHSSDEDFSTQIKARLTATELDQEDFANWSPEKIRKFEEQRLNEIANTNEGQRGKQDVGTFLAAHPEYKDCPTNSKLMNAALNLMGVSFNPTVDQLETAYDSFRSNGLLVLDKAEVARQTAEAAKQRADAHKKSKHTEEEMYAMDLDTLFQHGMGNI
jgi:ribosomal protein L14E/L6E/L27E